MSPNKPTPLAFYFWRRRAWRESRHAAYVKTVFHFLDERSACARIQRVMDRLTMTPLLPKG